MLSLPTNGLTVSHWWLYSPQKVLVKDVDILTFEDWLEGKQLSYRFNLRLNYIYDYGK